ncbi:MAG: hypothetical protein J6I49_07200 [Bacteroidales bacterium]|nr:hypothetical protein [Bacteroidales bacterium]
MKRRGGQLKLWMPAAVGIVFLLSPLMQQPLAAQDTVKVPRRSVERTRRVVPTTTPSSDLATGHSARKALLLSIVPGGGQIYNRQAWKIPVIYGAFAGVGYMVHYNYTRMSMFHDEYLYRKNHDGATQLEGYEGYSTNNIYSLYNSYNRSFQLMAILAVGVYALNLIDAYVFGHLFDFQIDNNLALSLQPSLLPLPDTWHPALALSFTF